MKTNLAGRQLIMDAEGLRLKAYRCPAGKWTVGYGHTGDVEPHHEITEHQAEEILEYDLGRFEEGVLLLTPGLGTNQFSALVCFAFNVGLGAFETSTLRKKILAGDFAGAADEFMKWTYSAKKLLPGLVKRRAAERALFLEVPS